MLEVKLYNVPIVDVVNSSDMPDDLCEEIRDVALEDDGNWLNECDGDFTYVVDLGCDTEWAKRLRDMLPNEVVARNKLGIEFYS